MLHESDHGQVVLFEFGPPHLLPASDCRWRRRINSGGEKVMALEVEAALLTHPSVVQAAVFPIDDARLGQVWFLSHALGFVRMNRCLASSPGGLPRVEWLVTLRLHASTYPSKVYVLGASKACKAGR